MYKKLTAVLLLSVLLADFSYGAGFALYEYSGRATAMGGAVMANKAEAASLATNPALITELEGTQAQVGLTVVTAVFLLAGSIPPVQIHAEDFSDEEYWIKKCSAISARRSWRSSTSLQSG